MRNGGWVTPQLDNIPEKAIFMGQLGGQWKKRKTLKRHTV